MMAEKDCTWKQTHSYRMFSCHLNNALKNIAQL